MKRVYVKWILIIAFMIMIFIFSNQPAVTSNKNNEVIIKILKDLGINLQSVWGDLANFIVRKSAHFLEYFILSLLIYNASRENYSIGRSILMAMVLVFFFACTDEVHQFFVPGRECRFRDVMIDTSGAAIAMLLVHLYHSSKKS